MIEKKYPVLWERLKHITKTCPINDVEDGCLTFAKTRTHLKSLLNVVTKRVDVIVPFGTNIDTMFFNSNDINFHILKRSDDVKNIFISHTHPDHVCELPLVIQMIYLSGFDKKLTVYVPEEFVEPFEIYLRSVYLLVERIPFELEIVGYSDGFKYENDFILEAVGNTHLHHYKEWIEKYSMPNLMQSYSFKIKINDIHIFYSGDIGSFDDIKNHLDGNNYVITELTHLNLTEFFEFIPSISVEEYIITHLGNSEDVKRLHIEIKKAGIDNITIAMDGMELPL